MTTPADQDPTAARDARVAGDTEDAALVPAEGDRDLAVAPGADVSAADAAPAAGADEWLVRPGTEVVDAAGTLVGRVDDIRDGYLVVRKGRFFVADYHIPFGAIGSHDDETIYLAVVADERAARVWHQRPSERGEGAAAADERYAAVDAETRMALLTDRDGNVRVPVLQEELVATRRPVVRGTVRIQTDVTEEDRTLEVPVTEERVRITRRRAGQDATGAEVMLDGGTFEVPFYGEDVDVERRVRVIEEIVITREAVETVRRVRGIVRREDVIVDDTGVPHADASPAALRPAETAALADGEATPDARRPDEV
jgi:uncharacterized protein (TIGR02271 family)